MNLPLKGNIKDLLHGQEWLKAVTNCAVFEEENTQWFHNKYGITYDINPHTSIKHNYVKQVNLVTCNSQT